MCRMDDEGVHMKLAMLGDICVGKTQISVRFIRNVFVEPGKATLGMFSCKIFVAEIMHQLK